MVTTSNASKISYTKIFEIEIFNTHAQQQKKKEYGKKNIFTVDV